MTIMIDYGPEVAELMERQVQHDPLESKRQEAIKWLGKKYVGHKVNRVKKLAEPLPMNFVRPNGGGR